uniref:Uncharacterized protein n=1 Tax=Rhizophora mucronata TaxID=61149 RepID=A0A2P2N2B9_RHIMU
MLCASKTKGNSCLSKELWVTIIAHLNIKQLWIGNLNVQLCMCVCMMTTGISNKDVYNLQYK